MGTFQAPTPYGYPWYTYVMPMGVRDTYVKVLALGSSIGDLGLRREEDSP